MQELLISVHASTGLLTETKIILALLTTYHTVAAGPHLARIDSIAESILSTTW